MDALERTVWLVEMEDGVVARSEYAGVFESVLENGLLHGSEDEADVRGIGGLGEATIISKCHQKDFQTRTEGTN